jgi:Tol biopolymer transport system component
LKSTDWRAPEKIVFSPDGRYIAYDFVVNDAADESHIFVSIDGSRQSAVVAHPSRNIVMGWAAGSPQHLLFASNRTGALSLWTLSISDGTSEGEARVARNLTSSRSLGMSSTGTMYIFTGGASRYFMTVGLCRTRQHRYTSAR